MSIFKGVCDFKKNALGVVSLSWCYHCARRACWQVCDFDVLRAGVGSVAQTLDSLFSFFDSRGRTLSHRKFYFERCDQMVASGFVRCKDNTSNDPFSRCATSINYGYSLS